MANTSETTVEHDLREIGTPKGALRYYDCGADSGPALLFLHGSGPGVTGWRNFRGILPTFAEHYRCLILEFPGFGVSDDFGGHPMVTSRPMRSGFWMAKFMPTPPPIELPTMCSFSTPSASRKGETVPNAVTIG